MVRTIANHGRSGCRFAGAACRKAFTLVELLVVIGIIAVLVSILLPSLNAARSAAQQTACLSNLHQIALGITMYIGENKSFLPYGCVLVPDATVTGKTAPGYRAAGWPETIAKQLGYTKESDVYGVDSSYMINDPGAVKGILTCPSYEVQRVFWSGGGGYTDSPAATNVPIGLSSYMVNSLMMPFRSTGVTPVTLFRARKVTETKRSAEIYLVMDGQSEFAYAGGAHALWAPPFGLSSPTNCDSRFFIYPSGTGVSTPADQNQGTAMFPHRKKMNMLYLDGHAGSLGRQDVVFDVSDGTLPGTEPNGRRVNSTTDVRWSVPWNAADYGTSNCPPFNALY